MIKYLCDECGASDNNGQAFRAIQSIHSVDGRPIPTNEKVFRVDLCSKCFGELRNYYKNKEEEREYQHGRDKT